MNIEQSTSYIISNVCCMVGYLFLFSVEKIKKKILLFKPDDKMILMVFSSYPMKEKIYVVPFTLPLVASLTCFSHKHSVAGKGDFFKVRNRDGGF